MTKDSTSQHRLAQNSSFLAEHRRVARNLQWGGGLFWRLETTSNDLDADFDRSSTRLSWFFCPSLGDLQQNKKKKKKKRSSPSFSGRNHIRSLTNTHRQSQWRGAIFLFSAKIGLKSAKNRAFCIFFRPPGYTAG